MKFIKLLIIFSCIFSINSYGKITSDYKHQFNINLLKECGIIFSNITSYPISKTHIYLSVLNFNGNLSQTCNETRNKFLDIYKKEMTSQSFSAGYEYSNSNLTFADLENRFYNNSGSFINYYNATNNLEINLRARYFNNKYIYDDSYINYYFSNKKISIGRSSKWWGPSEETSLILSNQARPFPSISLTNSNPVMLKNIGLLGHISYDFFIGLLEKDRDIPNTNLMGLRVEINPINSLNIGFSRVAQFGGDGRSVNFSTIKNIIIGKDNQGNESPGNQLGAIDFKYIYKKKNILYMQIVGEDEAGYLPSRTFYYFGATRVVNPSLDQRLSIEFVDTENKIPNYTYSHKFYFDGYRYFGKPLGANIDADSESISLVFKSFINQHTFLKASFSDGKINKNNNINNYITSEKTDFSKIDFYINYYLTKNDSISLKYSNFNGIKGIKDSFHINYEHKF